jgi:dihydropteroate synthase
VIIMDGLFCYKTVKRMRTTYTWTLPSVVLELGRRTAVMAILNVTPDSFSDGGTYIDPEKAVARALELEASGADILDIGGESSRPGSIAISLEEEIRRVMPVLEALNGKLRIPVSVDTYRSEVAHRALDSGAQIVNDISAFRFDPRMAEIVRRHRAGVVLMHSRGAREELHTQSPMSDAVRQVHDDLKTAIHQAVAAGIAKSSIVLDPGIGFGKRAEESLAVLRHLEALSPLECALLVGTSRKSFIRKVARIEPEAAYSPLWGTAATVASAVLQGAHIVRVHDVREMRTLVDVLDVIREQHPRGVQGD